MGKLFIPNHPLEIKNSNNELKISRNKSLNTTGSKFSDMLEAKKGGLKLSAHAKKRIISRNIKIDSAEMQRVEKGMDKLKEKGGQESVVISDNKAYLVSVKNNTIVTIVDNASLKDNVFTNIDSMIML